MTFTFQTTIVDSAKVDEYQKYLYRCLGGPPSKEYRKRIEYLEAAIPKGLHKKLLIFNGEIVGQIEYSPAEVSYYPVMGDNVTVMNCIWILRRAKSHDFGKQLLEGMIESEEDASSFATIALENHWSPWFRKDQIEKLGFKPLDSISVVNRAKRKQVFKICLMWMSNAKNARPPTWNRQKLLEGITSCTAHPLYHPQTYEPKQILQEQ